MSTTTYIKSSWDISEILARQFYPETRNKPITAATTESSDSAPAPKLSDNQDADADPVNSIGDAEPQGVEIQTPTGAKRIEVVSFTFTNPGFEDDDGASTADKNEMPPKYGQAASHDYSETCCETFLSYRWSLSGVLFLACWIISALKMNMGLAILCMVGSGYVGGRDYALTDRNLSSLLASNDSNATLFSHIIQETWYVKRWTRDSLAWVLSGFFYGHISSLLLGGYLSGKFGGRAVLITGTFILGLSNLAIPFAARIETGDDDQAVSAYVVLALRILSGVGAGFMLPSLFNLWGRWLPPKERSTHVAFCYSGSMVGNILVMGTGGYLCELTNLDGGWPLIFYISGGLTIICGVIFCFTVYDSPRDHPRISEKEKNYILNSLEQTQSLKPAKLPLRKIFSSKAVWAIFLVHLFFAFGDSVLVTKLSAFLEDVLGYNIDENGYILCAMFGAMFAMANTGPRLVDLCITRDRLSTAVARKLSTAIAMGGSAIVLLVAVHLPGLPDKNTLTSTILLIIAMGILNLNKAGFLANFVDIAPRYCGEIFAISTTISTLPGLGSPQLITFLTPNGTVNEWRVVFYVWAGLFLLGVILYSILAEGKEQQWAKETYEQLRGQKKKLSKHEHHKETEEWFESQFKECE